MSALKIPANKPGLQSPSGSLSYLRSYLIYPLVMTLGILLHLSLKPLLPLYWSTQLPVIAGALMIACLEQVIPYNPGWRPGKSEFGGDLLFMVWVQVLLPKGLTLGVALLLLQMQPVQADLWPQHWPVALQAGLMLLIGDFGRYWLHRWAHEIPLLWRFHAVHHAPQILYWNNVSRFHPLDKGLQFLADTLPFLVLGVRPEVFAFYFVFYALTGFFQHSNLDIRLGWLNYLISGPELHRWHHSSDPQESNSNYGNKVIFWDSLFGTRYLPTGRKVSELGLLNRTYPQGFLTQMKTPFIAGLSEQPRPVLLWSQILLNSCLQVRMQITRRRLLRPLLQAAQNPRQTQHEVLMQILRANQHTEFGRACHFEQITSIAAFRQQVPVQDYESLRPWIEKQAAQQTPVLTAAQPLMYNQTSGTTGRPKNIPLLARSLQQLKDSQNLFSLLAWDACPAGFSGKILGIVSPAVEGKLATGQPYGSASGQIYRQMPALARAKYVLPAELFALTDYELKYRLILRLALAEAGLSFLGSANPSTFQKLLDLLDHHAAELIQEIETGHCAGLDSLPPALQAQLRQRLRQKLRPDPARAAQLREVFAQQARPDLGAIWPGLALITTWTQGSCRIALDAIRHRIPASVTVLDPGYLASEFRGTLTLNAAGQGLPTLTENFFEFVEVCDWEAGIQRFLTLDQLQQEQSYYLFVTTPAGLYRYAMHDIVRVNGFCGQTPTLAFVQKGTGVTNITGEKLHEAQLLNAVRQSKAELGCQSSFYLALADARQSRYHLYLEMQGDHTPFRTQLARRVDQGLCEGNLEYRAKRVSGRLQPLQVHFLQTGAGEAYKADCLRAGQREGQFKMVALQASQTCRFDFTAWEITHQTAGGPACSYAA